MISLAAILICILVPALVIQALILRGTAFTFGRHRLTWGLTVIITVIIAALGVSSSIIGRFDTENVALVVIQLVCVLCIFVVPIILIKRALKIRTLVSIVIIVVTVIVSGIMGIAYAFGVRTYFIQAFRIPSAGMSPTLVVGDMIFTNKLVYRMGSPRRGEIVVFRYPKDTSKDFIKRIVAEGGDTIEIRNKKVFINGKPYENDPGTHSSNDELPDSVSISDNLSPVTVPIGSFFVLGDNRDNSLDSRFWGFVKAEYIFGRPSVIYWSYDSEAHRVRTERVGEHID
jgi:signal peptidase I